MRYGVLEPKMSSEGVAAVITFGDALESNELALVNDRFIDYQGIEVKLVFKKAVSDVYPGILVTTSLGTHDHTSFQVYFRFVYSAFELAGIVALIRQRNGIRWDVLTIEQKAILPLLLFGVVSNNPLYVFQAYSPRVL
jgi:hypothetical protein